MIRLFAAVLVALGILTGPSLAQSPKIFVASTGSDTNDGGRATPKRSFQAAHDAVAASGEIVVLDTAGYGPVTITKSVSIVVPAGVSGFVTQTSSTGNGVTINAGTSDIVTLRGLIVEGTGTGGGTGIYETSAGSLVIEDTTVRNFREGIFANTFSTSHVVIRGGAVRNTIYGIDIEGTATLNAIVTDTELTANDTAIYVAANAPVAPVRLVATRCAISGGSTGFAVYNTRAVADTCTISGVSTVFNNSASYIILSANTITESGTIFAVKNGGTNYTRGNNTIYDYSTLGTTPTALSGQ